MAVSVQESLENKLLSIDRLCGLLDSWVGLASRNEQLVCQSRNAIVFGMAIFITSGAAILATNEFYKLACLFAFFMTSCAAFLNHIFEWRAKAWHETLQILTRIQYNIIEDAQEGHADLNLQRLIDDECGYRGSNRPKTLTPYDIAKSMRRRFRFRGTDWGSRIFYTSAIVAFVVLIMVALNYNPQRPAVMHEQPLVSMPRR